MQGALNTHLSLLGRAKGEPPTHVPWALSQGSNTQHSSWRYLIIWKQPGARSARSRKRAQRDRDEAALESEAVAQLTRDHEIIHTDTNST